MKHVKRLITDFDLNDKKVIIRCDLNVPIKDGVILDDNRIKESLKTIKYAIGNNAKVIILSHLGRIKSEEDKIKNSLKPVAARLSELLQQDVVFVEETRGRVLEEHVKDLKPGEVLLVQNTRFEDYPDKKESTNDSELGKYWASLGDIFVNDAFGTAHRAHASNVGVASNLPSALGFLVEKELKMLEAVINNVKHPYTVIMGGAKMRDKIKVIDKLAQKADYLLFAGGIANTFLVASGYDLKASVYDEESVSYCKTLLDKYDDKIILPVDGYANLSYEDTDKPIYVQNEAVPDKSVVLDVGPKTINLFKKYILKSNTIFWNGPVGVFEFEHFKTGTKNICELLKESNAVVVVGGGDSASAVINLGYKNDFTHVSTGGGASLCYIEGKSLPGIEIINDK